MRPEPFSTLELARRHRKAWEALPECYQADDCLEFYEVAEILFAKPKPEEIPILGDWECFFRPHDGRWVDNETGRPVDE